MSGCVDTSKMKLVREREPRQGKGEWSEVYLDRVVENDNRITKHFVRANFMREWNEATGKTNAKPTLSHYRYSETNQKFLCLGGPHHGKKVAVPGVLYTPFNRADCTRGDRKKHHRVVYLFDTLLREDLL